MIIESQDGTAIAVMGKNSCIEVNVFHGGFELIFASTETLIGKFHELDSAKRQLSQIMEAYLRGDKQHKVAE